MNAYRRVQVIIQESDNLIFSTFKRAAVVSVPFWLAMSIAVFSVSGGNAAVQEVILERAAELRGDETLNLNQPVATGTLVPLPEGGWLFSGGYVEAWTWAEFAGDGSLRRAPGNRWTGGGPGEFRDVVGVFPLQGDTLIVLESFRATRVLRDGAYISRQFIPIFPTNNWVYHGGAYWITGQYQPGKGIQFLRIPRSGAEPQYVEVPLPTGSSSGIPVSWNGDLWVWAYPRGPLLRLNPDSWKVAERWQPQLGNPKGAGMRAFPTADGEGNLLFRIDPMRKWVAYDSRRTEILSQDIPEPYHGLYMVDPTWARLYLYEKAPVLIPTAVSVYRYRIVPQERY